MRDGSLSSGTPSAPGDTDHVNHDGTLGVTRAGTSGRRTAGEVSHPRIRGVAPVDATPFPFGRVRTGRSTGTSL
jgi:hypothetical protein